MAKRIDFIAPFEGLRGNVSGRQDLVYALNDNKAFEAPQGKRNYARNYKPRYVSAKRASDGRMYFSVRTRNGVTLSARSLQAMALLGGIGAIYAAIVNSDTLRNGVEMVYRYLIDRTRQGLHGGIPLETTFRQYASGIIRTALESKAQVITFAGGGGVQPVNVNNPWVDGGTGTAISVSTSVLAQFWQQLAVGGIYFYVDSRRGIAKTNLTFNQISDGTVPYATVLELETDEVEGVNYITYNGRYLIDSAGEYVKGTDTVIANARLRTTDVAPTA